MTLDTAEYLRSLCPDFRWLDRENKTAARVVYQDELALAKAGIAEANAAKIAANQTYTAWKDRWGLELLQEALEENINMFQGLVKRYAWILLHLAGRRATGGITDDDIRRAKEVPIENFYKGRLREVGGRLVGLCPFHSGGKERTPSFVIYKNNTYHCFGCSANGDTIEYVMETQKLEFIETVKYLINT